MPNKHQIIKQYLANHHPPLHLSALEGTFYLRFELGGEILKNGTIERVNQAVNRAYSIYQEAIGDGEVLVVIEEYKEEFFDLYKKNKNYLYKLLPLEQWTRYKGPFDQIYYEQDEQGVLVQKIAENELEADVLLGKLVIDKTTSRQLLRGQANLEMGFEPAIPQDLYYYSLDKDIGFRMYDDRGCDVWSASKEQLRPLYEQFKNWILEYNRAEIEAQFKHPNNSV